MSELSNLFIFSFFEYPSKVNCFRNHVRMKKEKTHDFASIEPIVFEIKAYKQYGTTCRNYDMNMPWSFVNIEGHLK